MNRFVLIAIAMLAWTAETMWRCHADSELREQQLAAMGDFNPPSAPPPPEHSPSVGAPRRVNYYAAWEQAKDAAFLGDQPRVTITAAEYAALTNGMEHIRRAAERRRKAAADARKRAEEAAARAAEEIRSRGVQRVRDIRRLREEAKKGTKK